MLNEFSRQELLLGSENMQKLKNSKVIIFGVGGVGGYVAEGLARAGIGRIDVVDNDVVTLTNINRQIIALQETIGFKKVDLIKDRLLKINPNLEINAYNLFYNIDNSDKINLKEYDYVIDAIDTISSKLELITQAKNVGVKIISSMGTGNKVDPTKFIVDDIFNTKVCPLAKVMRKELKQRGIDRLKVCYSREIPLSPLESEEKDRKQTIGSVSFVPPVAGFVIAGEVVKDLIGFVGNNVGA